MLLVVAVIHMLPLPGVLGAQPIAFVAGFISVTSFLVIAWHTDGYNEQVGRVFIADIVALVCLVIGLAAYAHSLREDSDA